MTDVTPSPGSAGPAPGVEGVAIEVTALRKAYGSILAVDDVSLRVAGGEIFGLLGRNGAGKTTIVECVEGLRLPDAGQIRVLGLNPRTDHPALSRQLGVQLQESALPAKIRLGEAVSLFASFYDHAEDPAALIETLGLTDKVSSYYKNLSGGQKQRLSIALALVGRPRVVIFDELTTGLDPQARRETWTLVEAVRDRGVTVVLVTHDMEEAQYLCAHIALIDAGRVVAVDTPSGLVEAATGGKRVRFRPSAPFDDALLTGQPGVRDVVHDGEWVTVHGDGDLVNTVILTLSGVGVVARDVTLDAGALEDAFLTLTNAEGVEGVADGPRVEAVPKGPVASRRLVERVGGLGRRPPGGMRPPRGTFRALLRNEWRLGLRNPASLVWGVGFPALLLIIFGSIPATNTHLASFGGLTFFEVYLPVMIGLGLTILALISMPTALTSYRELGVLRRLSTTPVPPSWVLGAQVVLNLFMLGFAAVIVAVGSVALFGVSLPIEPGGMVLALALGAAEMFALGIWVAAVARTQRAASAIGGGLFYPMAFFAGTWLPQESMPTGLRLISEYTPLGAAVHALDWSMLLGRFPTTQALATMVAWALLFGWLAVRMFRWE